MDVSLVMVVSDMFVDQELLEAKMTCEEENISYRFVSFSGGAVTGAGGLSVMTDALPSRDTLLSYQAIVLVDSEQEFCESDATQLTQMINEYVSHGKAIATIGSSILLLRSSDILAQRRVAAPQETRTVLESCGATLVDEPVVVDGTLFSAQGVQQTYQLIHALADYLRKEYS